MVFNLTDSILEYTPEQESLVIVCITNLLIGYYEGNNILMASDRLCDNFSSLIKEDRALRALNYLKNHTSYDYDVEWKMKVVLTESACFEKHEVPIFFFYKTSTIQAVKILGENENDIDFYIKITEMIKGSNQLNCIKLNGGGSHTCEVLKKIQGSHDCFCTCIVDSDIKYPNCEKGNTCKLVERAYQGNLKNINLIIIPVHEVENFLPYNFLKEITNNDGRTFLTKLKEHNYLNVLKYYDIKHGIKVADMSKSADYYRFAKDIYENIYNKKITFDKYLSQLEKKNEKNVFPAIKNNPIQEFLTYKKTIDISNPYIGNVVKEIYTIACARENIPIN